MRPIGCITRLAHPPVRPFVRPSVYPPVPYGVQAHNTKNVEKSKLVESQRRLVFDLSKAVGLTTSIRCTTYDVNVYGAFSAYSPL